MVPLIADRFLPITATLVRDLATNGVARLRLERAVGDGIGWLDRVAALGSLWHPMLAECLDAGVLGTHHRFEAYRVGLRPSPASRDPRALAAARRSVAAFLRACGVDPGLLEAVVDAQGGPAAMPGAFGSVCAAGDAASSRRAWWGLRLLPRPVLSALAERLAEPAPPGLSIVEVEARPGSGGRLLLRHCAREGRRFGWVPVAAESLRWNDGRPVAERAQLEETLAARHVLVLVDERAPDSLARHVLARIVLRLGLRSRLPRLLVTLVHRRSGRGGLALTPLAPGDLQQALVTNSAAMRRRAETAAEGCGGLPGPFVEAVRRSRAPVSRPRTTRGGGSHVHEAHAPYAVDAAGTGARPGTIADPARPAAPSALVCGTLAKMAALVARGRLTAGERVLRRAQGALARRARHDEAATLALASGRLLLRAGQPAAARRQFESALETGDRSGPSSATLQAAACLGRCLVDQVEPDAAEALLRSAWASAHLCADGHATLSVGAQLGRVLWWQGRFDEARHLLCEHPIAQEASRAGSGGARELAPEQRQAFVSWWAEAARAALACGDQAGVTRALGCARAGAQHADSDARLEWLLARAWWEAATGDADALLGTVRDGLVAARRMRGRSWALELRVVALEGLVRAGRRAAARRAATRLRRTLGCEASPLLSARARLALAVAGEHPSAARLRVRLVERGIGACAPGAAGVLTDWPTWSASRSPAMIDDVIEVVRVCQEEADAQRALERLAGMLAQRLHATGALVLVGARRPATISSPSAGRLPLCAARRALDTGLLLEPHGVGGGLEAAAPVRYGGAVIGAIACRWLDDGRADGARATALLSTGAAAAAPCVETLARAMEPPALPQVESELLGTSEAMEQVRRAVARAADAPFPVLVSAESGCGKELVARALHRASVRRTRAFCALNCAALPDDLLEAELFGHTRGAFTGAAAERRGLFEEADGGVLFLDEVGELSPRGQAKLLRVLQEGEVRRLGESMARRVDPRVVAATNRVLEREADEGRFRRDLLYRLDVIRIVVPPLRERVEDVPLLAAAFWERAAARLGSRAVLSDAALAALARHQWPGNVRELQNVIAALAVQAPRRGSVGVQTLGAVLRQAPDGPTPVRLDEARRHFEARFVRAALARAGGNRGRAARELGLTRQGLGKLMGRLGVADRELVEGAALGRAAAATP